MRLVCHSVRLVVAAVVLVVVFGLSACGGEVATNSAGDVSADSGPGSGVKEVADEAPVGREPVCPEVSTVRSLFGVEVEPSSEEDLPRCVYVGERPPGDGYPFVGVELEALPQAQVSWADVMDEDPVAAHVWPDKLPVFSIPVWDMSGYFSGPELVEVAGREALQLIGNGNDSTTGCVVFAEANDGGVVQAQAVSISTENPLPDTVCKEVRELLGEYAGPFVSPAPATADAAAGSEQSSDESGCPLEQWTLEVCPAATAPWFDGVPDSLWVDQSINGLEALTSSSSSSSGPHANVKLSAVANPSETVETLAMGMSECGSAEAFSEAGQFVTSTQEVEVRGAGGFGCQRVPGPNATHTYVDTLVAWTLTDGTVLIVAVANFGSSDGQQLPLDPDQVPTIDSLAQSVSQWPLVEAGQVNGDAAEGEPILVTAQLRDQGFSGTDQLIPIVADAAYHVYAKPYDGTFRCDWWLMSEDYVAGAAYADHPILAGSRVRVTLDDEDQGDGGQTVVDLEQVTPTFLMSNPAFDVSKC